MHVQALIPPRLKPQLNLIMNIFVNELLHLGTVGTPIYDCYKLHTRTLYVRLLHCVCDLPARKALQCIAGPNAYCGCYYCYILGAYNGTSVSYPNDPPFCMRTTEHYFNAELRSEHLGFQGFSNLARLVYVLFDAIWDVPIDAMHNCFLGITKRLFCHWFRRYPSVRHSMAAAEALMFNREHPVPACMLITSVTLLVLSIAHILQLLYRTTGVVNLAQFSCWASTGKVSMNL